MLVNKDNIMPSESVQTQSGIFCARWLPALFHHTPERFLNLLNHDGNKFLRFYWDLAGKDLPPEKCRGSFGLNFTFRNPARNTLITLVTLPEPQTAGETYFMALIYRPNRHLFLVSDMTKVIALEKAEQADPLLPSTRLVEIIPRRIEREVLPGEPVDPILDEFYNAVIKQLD